MDGTTQPAGGPDEIAGRRAAGDAKRHGVKTNGNRGVFAFDWSRPVRRPDDRSAGDSRVSYGFRTLTTK